MCPWVEDVICDDKIWFQEEDIHKEREIYANRNTVQILPRQAALHRHPRRDQVPVQGPLDAGLPKTD